MDCTLRPIQFHPASDLFILRQLLELRERGYSPAECRLIYHRAKEYLNETLEPDPVQGVVIPTRREITLAIKEVLADSVDLAAKQSA